MATTLVVPTNLSAASNSFRHGEKVCQKVLTEGLHLRGNLPRRGLGAMQGFVSIKSQSMGPIFQCRRYKARGCHVVNSLFQLPSVNFWSARFQCGFQRGSEHCGGGRPFTALMAIHGLEVQVRHIFRCEFRRFKVLLLRIYSRKVVSRTARPEVGGSSRQRLIPRVVERRRDEFAACRATKPAMDQFPINRRLGLSHKLESHFFCSAMWAICHQYGHRRIPIFRFRNRSELILARRRQSRGASRRVRPDSLGQRLGLGELFAPIYGHRVRAGLLSWYTRRSVFSSISRCAHQSDLPAHGMSPEGARSVA